MRTSWVLQQKDKTHGNFGCYVVNEVNYTKDLQKAMLFDTKQIAAESILEKGETAVKVSVTIGLIERRKK